MINFTSCAIQLPIRLDSTRLRSVALAMAELGDFSSEIEGNDAPATVDMCDYGYVNECNDKKKLGGILRLLRSGKEGHYPEVTEYFHKCILLLQDTLKLSWSSPFLRNDFRF